MSNVALYRKYRSKRFEDVVGQHHITTALINAIKNGRVSHAYLFTGPRGVGKTSVARILAHAVNELPYEHETNYLDIIEIDAASNRRIDEIRELRDKIHLAPANAKYKVYIIDEVHMLTKEAFNALLKTLEEPPEHAIFILATTEAHKLPETIVSRTQRFSFKPIEIDDQVKHLRTIAKKEKISVSDEALKLIAQHAAGSFRDSIGLLDQLSNAGHEITLESAESIIGLAPMNKIAELVVSVSKGDIKGIVQSLQLLREQGYQPSPIAGQLASQLRADILDDTSHDSKNGTVALLGSLLSVAAAPDQDLALEVTLIQAALENKVMSPDAEGPDSNHSPLKDTADPMDFSKEQQAKTEPITISASAKPISLDDFETVWATALAELKKTHNTLYGVIRMSKATLSNSKIIVQFEFPFHLKKINEDKNRKVIEDVFSRTSGVTYEIVCELLNKSQNQDRAASVNKSSIDTISNIFGGAEVLES